MRLTIHKCKRRFSHDVDILSFDFERRGGMKQRIGSKLNYHPPDTGSL